MPPSQQRRGQVLKITAVNEYHLPLLREGMGELLSDAKFAGGMHIFCMDAESFRWCESLAPRVGRCLRTNETLAGADFGKGDYYQHIWLKWRLVQQSLKQEQEVEGVYWLDADVAVFSDIEACADTGGADFMYQLEVPWEPQRVNGGQLWFRRCEAVSTFVSRVLKHASDWDGKLDQEYAQLEMGWVPGLRVRPLPQERFQSHCWTKNVPVTSRSCTYHPVCETGVADKRRAMREARKRYKAAALPT